MSGYPNHMNRLQRKAVNRRLNHEFLGLLRDDPDKFKRTMSLALFIPLISLNCGDPFWRDLEGSGADGVTE